TAVNAVKGVRLTGTGGAGVRVTGTAAARLNLPTGGTAQPTLLALPRVPVGRLPFLTRSFDLDPGTGANRRLVIGDGTNTAAPLVFAPPNPGDFGSVTPEELRDLINAHIAAHNATVAAGAAVRVRADVQIALPEGGFFAQGPSEIAYSTSEPDTVWVGGGDGSVFRSSDD